MLHNTIIRHVVPCQIFSIVVLFRIQSCCVQEHEFGYYDFSLFYIGPLSLA